MTTTPYSITLDYPPPTSPRYGWGKPAHPRLHQIFNRTRQVYENYLRTFLTYRDHLIAIPKWPSETAINAPAWINGSLPGLDAVALYSLIASTRPTRYLEIGAGYSTKFAKQAILDHNLATKIIAIDPYPPPGIEEICDTLITQPLEDLELTLFEQLTAGDILFVDSTHRVWMNSDVTVICLDILPRLPAGVLVEFHDIALPWDYPPHWVEKYYSEQYLLASYLLAEGNKCEVILPNAFITLEEPLRQIMTPLWQEERLNGTLEVDLLAKLSGQIDETMKESIDTHGSSLWLRIT